MSNIKFVPEGIDDSGNGISHQPQISDGIVVDILDCVEDHSQGSDYQRHHLWLTEFVSKHEEINEGDNDGTHIPERHNGGNGHEWKCFEAR
mmetsp:Transcript_32339/g.50142  ORF Transcript_32339/g.50142 Transcript_32339/m.50142 type:complete len:91 (+) Transcript_32339:448-720(+)